MGKGGASAVTGENFSNAIRHLFFTVIYKMLVQLAAYKHSSNLGE